MKGAKIYFARSMALLPSPFYEARIGVQVFVERYTSTPLACTYTNTYVQYMCICDGLISKLCDDVEKVCLVMFTCHS